MRIFLRITDAPSLRDMRGHCNTRPAPDTKCDNAHYIASFFVGEAALSFLLKKDECLGRWGKYSVRMTDEMWDVVGITIRDS